MSLQNIQPLRQNGNTYALSVTNSAHAAVTITANDADQPGYVELLNLGTVAVAMTFAPAGSSAITTPVFPTDGSPQQVIVLPPNMTAPITKSAPGASFIVSAIAAAAGPALVYVTPVAP
ncbi:hypothetical protein [Tolumonas lignilytica]|uniref:hypothetical protein n=1 Tax=Tolumonas lignilytica TaxID=1283284 RepID=UPI0004634CB7|nr:hypothetical protein [Tolumonas lignilytica]